MYTSSAARYKLSIAKESFRQPYIYYFWSKIENAGTSSAASKEKILVCSFIFTKTSDIAREYTKKVAARAEIICKLGFNNFCYYIKKLDE